MKKKISLGVTLALLGLLVWVSASYGRQWVAFAQTRVCVRDAPQDGVMGVMTGAVTGALCDRNAAATATTVWGSGEKRVVLTATKVLPSATPDLAQVKPTTVGKSATRVIRKGTPLPSATPLPATSTPGPPVPLPTPTRPRNSGSGKIGGSTMPCAMEKVAGGGMAIQCKKVVP